MAERVIIGGVALLVIQLCCCVADGTHNLMLLCLLVKKITIYATCGAR